MTRRCHSNLRISARSSDTEYLHDSQMQGHSSGFAHDQYHAFGEAANSGLRCTRWAHAAYSGRYPSRWSWAGNHLDLTRFPRHHQEALVLCLSRLSAPGRMTHLHFRPVGWTNNCP